MARRIRAKLTFKWSDDGTIVAEIVTSSPLGPFHAADGTVYQPEEHLRWESNFALGISAPWGQPWRYPEVRVSAAGHPLVDRIFDMSEGSDERAVVAAIAGQPQLPVVWVDEGVEVLYTPFHTIPGGWRQALESTKGISAEAWREEIDELLWSQSASWRPGPRPRRHRRRTASLPAGAALPFFARRSGAIPRAGSPQLDGVTLPAGSRQPPRPAAYWVTDEPVANLELLVPWLVSQFEQTGLWPLLWRFEEDPHNYMYGHGDLDAIDGVDLHALLARSGDDQPPSRDIAVRDTDAHRSDEDSGADPFPDWALSEPARLLLVPCNRPADAVTALGGVAADIDPPQISAVLRCWETRYGAILFEVAPGLVRLSVAHPPTDHGQALIVAAEMHALSAESSDVHHQTVEQVAAELLGVRPHAVPPHEPALARTSWDIPC